MPNMSWLLALDIVVMTTCGAASDDKVDSMTTLAFQGETRAGIGRYIS